MIIFDANHLWELRRAKGLSQYEIAKLMNCNTSTISNWELSKSKITAEKLAKLANIYGVNHMENFFINTFDMEEKDNEKDYQ